MELGVILGIHVAHLRHVLLDSVLWEGDASAVRVFLFNIVGGWSLLRELSRNFLGWWFLKLRCLRVEPSDRERFHKGALKFEVQGADVLLDMLQGLFIKVIWGNQSLLSQLCGGAWHLELDRDLLGECGVEGIGVPMQWRWLHRLLSHEVRKLRGK